VPPTPQALIDVPVSAYSDPQAIEEWMVQLRLMNRTPEVADAIEQAQRWLDAAGDQVGIHNDNR
jgi:hypothetical protein